MYDYDTIHNMILLNHTAYEDADLKALVYHSEVGKRSHDYRFFNNVLKIHFRYYTPANSVLKTLASWNFTDFPVVQWNQLQLQKLSDGEVTIGVVEPHMLKKVCSGLDAFGLEGGKAPLALSQQIWWRLSTIYYETKPYRGVIMPSVSTRKDLNAKLESIHRDWRIGIRDESYNREKIESLLTLAETVRSFNGLNYLVNDLTRVVEHGPARVESLRSQLEEAIRSLPIKEAELQQARIKQDNLYNQIHKIQSAWSESTFKSVK